MKNHFSTKNDSYDYVKYRGRVSIPENTYLKRKDRAIFKDLSKKYKISRERIRQIENKAFEKLQKHMLLLAKSKNLLPSN